MAGEGRHQEDTQGDGVQAQVVDCIEVIALDEQIAQQVEDCLDAMWKKKPRVTYDNLVLTLLKDMETKLTKIEGRLDRIEKKQG